MQSNQISLFRTRAWVQSWVEIWGNHPRIKLIDLGERGDALEMVYSINHRLKGVVPVRSLVIAGNGYADFNPPRAEYNNLDSFIELTGGTDSLVKRISSLKWNQWVLSDLEMNNRLKEIIDNLSANCGIRSRLETSYRVNSNDFSVYKQQLSATTRKKYFNDREKLESYGPVELIELSSVIEFLRFINEFHRNRWGRNCYSDQTMEFIKLFVERIRNEGGIPVMQLMLVNSEPASIIFDIVWNGVRYNLQSGFTEKKFANLALGSMHLGFAIEQSINSGLIYDMLAGQGKNTDYKKKIATEEKQMFSAVIARGWLKKLYQIYDKDGQSSPFVSQSIS